MAERMPAEGRVWFLNVAIRGTVAVPGTLYCGLFTSQTESTVPGDDMVLATPTGIVEATGTGYARQLIDDSSWDPPVAGGGGTQITADQITFPAPGSGGWGEIMGGFVATALTSGLCVMVANFGDEQSVTADPAEIIKVTPTIRFLP